MKSYNLILGLSLCLTPLSSHSAEGHGDLPDNQHKGDKKGVGIPSALDASAEYKKIKGPASNSKTYSNEVVKQRKADKWSQCLGVEAKDKKVDFQKALEAATSALGSNARAPQFTVHSPYKVTKTKPTPASLHSHEMCQHSKAELNSISKKSFNDVEVKLVNEYAELHNKLRKNKDQKGLDALWTRMMSCLTYEESLGDADAYNKRNRATVVAAAKKISIDPAPAVNPGVKQYFDAAQDNKVSAYNIGLFQLSPDRKGNVHSCITAWNAHMDKVKPKDDTCKVSTSISNKDFAAVLNSSSQAFNAFCGVQKVHDTMAVQVNTTASWATSPKNKKDGKLKAGKDRCVSLNFKAGKAYNHFGPFQKTVAKKSEGKSNLHSLYSCALGKK